MWKKVFMEFSWFLVPLWFGFIMGLGFWAEYGDLTGIIWVYWMVGMVAILLDHSITQVQKEMVI